MGHYLSEMLHPEPAYLGSKKKNKKIKNKKMGRIEKETSLEELQESSLEELQESPIEVVKKGQLEDPEEVAKKGPSPEEVEQYKTEFSDTLKAFEEKRWEISESGNFAANDVGIYLLDFMKKYAFWSKTEWMGMIKMEEEIKKAMGLASEDTPLQFNYQALEFCAFMLANPGGTGIELAREFEDQAEKYAKIGIVVGTKIEEARKQLKELQYLQERWAAGEQGFFYEREPEPSTDSVPVTVDAIETLETPEGEINDPSEVKDTK